MSEAVTGSKTNLSQASSVKASMENIQQMKGKRSNSKFGSNGNLGSRTNLSLSKSNLKASSKHGSKAAIAENPRAIVYENTYQMKPTKKFPTQLSREICQKALKKHLTGVKYDFEQVPILTTTIANEILEEAKKLDCPRYKIVVDVNIGEFKGQGIKVASRAVWDTTTDTYASASFKNATLFAVAMIFGCFFE